MVAVPSVPIRHKNRSVDDEIANERRIWLMGTSIRKISRWIVSGVLGALIQRRHVAYYFRPVLGSDESARGLILYVRCITFLSKLPSRLYWICMIISSTTVLLVARCAEKIIVLYQQGESESDYYSEKASYLLLLLYTETSISSQTFLFFALFTLSPKDSNPGLTDTLWHSANNRS